MVSKQTGVHAIPSQRRVRRSTVVVGHCGHCTGWAPLTPKGVLAVHVDDLRTDWEGVASKCRRYAKPIEIAYTHEGSGKACLHDDLGRAMTCPKGVA